MESKFCCGQLRNVHPECKTPPPPPPQVNMFHLYFSASAERLTRARDEIPKADKIWLDNRFQPAALENLDYTEIYAGEGLLAITDEELFGTFLKLIKLAAA